MLNGEKLELVVSKHEGFDLVNENGRSLASLREIKGKWHACCGDIPWGETEHLYEMEDIWFGVRFLKNRYGQKFRTKEDVQDQLIAIKSPTEKFAEYLQYKGGTR